MTTLILHVYIYYCFPPKTREKVLDASNGDDGVLEVRLGTIVKLVASDISTTNSFSLRKACDKLGLCVMMPYIASLRYDIRR